MPAGSRPANAALGVRRTEAGTYPAPSQATFSRIPARVSKERIEQRCWPTKPRCAARRPRNEIVVLDGKMPGHSGGLNVVTAKPRAKLKLSAKGGGFGPGAWKNERAQWCGSVYSS